ncbi:MAG: hypothetical protein JWO19_1241 [Bryobacterales bacterium]|jgi:hypothetical protein|nr:hypothetical protein [Bryobacterales bacterium]
MHPARGSREELQTPRREFRSTSSRKWILLSPSKGVVPDSFARVHTDARGRDKLLGQMQKLRGKVYLEDGAIDAAQLTDGRHRVDIDERSWHLLVVDKDGQVCGCVRQHAYPDETPFSQLNVSRSALAHSPDWGRKLKAAVESERDLSRRLNLPCVEIGGWALAAGIRGTTEAVRMALAMYSLSQVLGGSVGISTVTRRHCSASILRRIGGRSLEYEGLELPPYEDHQFKCEMEVLRFYSWAPNPRYSVWIEEIKEELRSVSVLADGAEALSWNRERPRRSSTPDFLGSTAPAFP